MVTIYVLRTKSFCYIGSTVNFNRRRSQHRTMLFTGRHAHKEMVEEVRLFGKSCISIQILELCEEQSRFVRERYWLSIFESKENVLNRRDPINQNWSKKDRLGVGNIGKKRTEDQKRRPIEAHIGKKGRTLTREQSLKMNSMRGPHTKEQREKCRALGFSSGKPVKNLDTGQVYPSGRQAAKSVGARQQSISDACRGKLQRVQGYRWSYNT